MAKGTKETDFFKGNRREAILLAWHVLQTKAGEKHMRFSVKLPLSNQPLIGMPEWISISYQAMESDGSAQVRAKVDRYLEGQTLEVFATDQQKSPALSLTGITLKDLVLQRDGSDEKSEVFLYATIYSPANIQARDWAWQNLRGTFYMACEYSQTELSFKDDEDDEDSDEENFMGPEHDKDFASSPALVKPRRGRPHANA